MLSDDTAILAEADCILLPVSTTENSSCISRALAALHSDQLIFSGKPGLELRAQAARQGLILRDYLQREELAVANAVPTAEGAVQLAMEHLPITIHGSQILITGFGRVGLCTAQRFRALGAQVTICARSPAQLALAESLGCRSIPLAQLPEHSFCYDLIINTIPARVFTSPLLSQVTAPLLLELASSPGGFDPDALHALDLHLISAPGLPGKAAPLTAARIIQKTIYHMLEELES